MENTNIDRITQQVELLDQRLDNIDSVVTALVERVMKQPVMISVTCPKCGEIIEISVTSATRTGSRSSVT